MDKSIQPSDLMRSHVELQMGTYFDHIENLGHGISFASSQRISDFYWNYAFGLQCSPEDLPDRVADIRVYAAKIHRRPSLYITPDTCPQNLDQILSPKDTSSEVWMVFEKTNLQPSFRISGLQISTVDNAGSLEEFIRVFRDAYGSSDPDEPGYSGLPEEYPESIRSANPIKGVQATHFIGSIDNKPVSISTIFCKPPYAGLYNVGTIHSARRKQLGTVMSEVAVAHAFESGCRIIFLQTEANSPVEDLYRKMGFRRQFIGVSLILE